MKHLFLTTSIAFLLVSQTIYGQNVAINNDASLPDAKAILDIKSTTKGVLIPRMLEADRLLITTSVPLGLMVFQTDGVRGLYYNASALPGVPNWKKISNGDDLYWTYTSPGYIYNNDPFKFGIGTNAPISKLHVEQTGYGFLHGNTGETIQVGTYVDANGGGIGTKTKDNLYFFTNNSLPIMSVDTFANVGIGTTIPAYKFTVKQNNIGITQESTDGTMRMGFYTNPTTGAILQTHTNHPLGFATNNSVAQATLLTNGNFGIGTTTPSNRFTVKIDNIGMSQESIDGLVKIGFYTASAGAFLQTHTNHPLLFSTNNGTAQAALLTNGNFGVGNSNPALGKFVVRGVVGATSAVFGDNTTGVAIENNFPGIGLNTYYNGSRLLIGNGGGGYIGLNPTNSRITIANSGGSGSAGGAANLQDKMWIDYDGTVSLGSSNLNLENALLGSGYKLKIYGKAIAEEVRVQLKSAWPDYVFKKDYKLMPLAQVEKFIEDNHHLPGFKKAEVIEKEGSDLGETQRKLLEKVEELTLYIINQQKQIDALKKDLESSKKNN